MTSKQAEELGAYIRKARQDRHVSARAVARDIGIDAAQVLRLERGEVAAPQGTVLGGLAASLRIPINDLLTLAGYPTSRTLPTIEPYLRAKYPRLTAADVDTVAALVQRLNDRSTPTIGEPRGQQR